MRRLFALVFLGFAMRSSATTVLTVFTLSSRTNVDFTVAGTDQKVASFLVADPTLASFDAILSFANDCNVQHFTRSSLDIPINKVRIAVNGGPIQDLWTRAGSDCTTMLSWTPTAPFSATYQIDVFISWNSSPMSIAGFYSETMNINAFIP